MPEVQLTMFDEVMHPLLKDFKCRCGSKDVKITVCGGDRDSRVGGVYKCNVCKLSEAFSINKPK